MKQNFIVQQKGSSERKCIGARITQSRVVWQSNSIHLYNRNPVSPARIKSSWCIFTLYSCFEHVHSIPSSSSRTGFQERALHYCKQVNHTCYMADVVFETVASTSPKYPLTLSFFSFFLRLIRSLEVERVNDKRIQNNWHMLQPIKSHIFALKRRNKTDLGWLLAWLRKFAPYCFATIRVAAIHDVSTFHAYNFFFQSFCRVENRESVIPSRVESILVVQKLSRVLDWKTINFT